MDRRSKQAKSDVAEKMSWNDLHCLSFAVRIKDMFTARARW